jgi:hypothetical protein
MAQTTGGMSFRNVALDISTNNSDWTDIAGVANKIKTKGGGRKSGAIHTATGDKPVITVGKKDEVTVALDIVYSEVSTEAYTLLHGYKETATSCYLRWAPKGTATGNYRYTSDVGYVTDCPEPNGDVDKADPILVSAEFTTPGITRAVIT